MSDQRDWDEADRVEKESEREALREKRRANLALAREARKTRGRPASRPETAPMPREANPSGDPTVEDLERMIEAVDRGDTHLTRESNSGVATTFDVPEQGKRPGWDYTWWPFKITGEEVDASTIVEYTRGGWIPVPATHFPSLVPRGWRKPVIERQGMRLFMRPQRLSDEAKTETYRQAFEQKANRLAAAQAGDAGREFAPRDSRAGGISTEIKPLM